MAGDWIKMRAAIFTHPKVMRIARALECRKDIGKQLSTGLGGALREIVTRDVTRDITVASLMRVWGAANEHTDDGVWHGIQLEDLDHVAGIPGFGAMMEAVGWAVFDAENQTVTFPNFLEYNAPAKSGRGAGAAERQRRYREKKRTGVTHDVTHNGDVTGDVEKRREEKKKELPAGGEAPPPKVRKQPDGDHAEFIRRWTVSYPIHHDGEDYVFQGAKDGAQVARLLKAVVRTPAEWQRLFVAAWKRPDLFNCKSAASIAGFASRVNEIIAELNSLHRPPPEKSPDAFKVPMNKPPERPTNV